MTDYLVDVLCAATGDAEPLAEDVQLVREAEGWLDRNGWDAHWRMGFISREGRISFRAEADEPSLMVCRKSEHGEFWTAKGDEYRLPDMRAALNMLCVLGILPARFSTFGQQALHEHAEACERAADILEERGANHGNAAYDEAVGTSEGLRRAASSARRHYPLRVDAA